MFENLQKKKFILCKSFLKPEFATRLGNEFSLYCKDEQNNVEKDTSYYKHNYPAFMELMVDKNRNISHFLKRNTLPTYTVARLFKTDDFQKVAIDGPSSEVGVLICLFQDSAWNLFFQTQEGYTQDYNLGVGDAMIYLASEVKHWKPRYAGQNAVYITNYYVRSRGPNGKYAFNNNLP